MLAPHIGSASRETRLEHVHHGCGEHGRGLKGERPPNLVNPEALDSNATESEHNNARTSESSLPPYEPATRSASLRRKQHQAGSSGPGLPRTGVLGFRTLFRPDITSTFRYFAGSHDRRRTEFLEMLPIRSSSDLLCAWRLR